MGIAKLVDPGYYADGGGLYLQITLSGSRSWVYKFMLAGRSREMGLGALSVLSLAAVPKEAVECRVLVKQGIDPIENRRRVQTERAAADAPSVTFKQAAEAAASLQTPPIRECPPPCSAYGRRSTPWAHTARDQ
ncbi:Arm DNA-binding domain-containing protein [Burkholderia plantarii]|nr:Arm DNA-binding domain-containing protein [Burkholderia plantarii]